MLASRSLSAPHMLESVSSQGSWTPCWESHSCGLFRHLFTCASLPLTPMYYPHVCPHPPPLPVPIQPWPGLPDGICTDIWMWRIVAPDHPRSHPANQPQSLALYKCPIPPTHAQSYGSQPAHTQSSHLCLQHTSSCRQPGTCLSWKKSQPPAAERSRSESDSASTQTCLCQSSRAHQASIRRQHCTPTPIPQTRFKPDV